MLHATIHAVRHEASAGEPHECESGRIATLALTTSDLEPLAVTFEAAAAALEALPRLYFEPDGSFLWVSSEGPMPWQLEGQLQDRGAQLDHVEIKGTCDAAAFAALQQALGGDSHPLVFQLVQAAVVIDEATAQHLLTPASSGYFNSFE
jgi:hypothetical protein